MIHQDSLQFHSTNVKLNNQLHTVNPTTTTNNNNKQTPVVINTLAHKTVIGLMPYVNNNNNINNTISNNVISNDTPATTTTTSTPTSTFTTSSVTPFNYPGQSITNSVFIDQSSHFKNTQKVMLAKRMYVAKEIKRRKLQILKQWEYLGDHYLDVSIVNHTINNNKISYVYL